MTHSFSLGSMMPKRKGLSSSIRWSVFARDGFSCRYCGAQAGEGAGSLVNAPTSDDVIERLSQKSISLAKQAEAMSAAIKASEYLRQEAINLKCFAYGTDSIRMEPGEKDRITAWGREFGADRVLEWYQIASSRGISERMAIRYVSGIVKNIRDQEGSGA